MRCDADAGVRDMYISTPNPPTHSYPLLSSTYTPSHQHGTVRYGLQQIYVLYSNKGYTTAAARQVPSRSTSPCSVQWRWRDVTAGGDGTGRMGDV